MTTRRDATGTGAAPATDVAWVALGANLGNRSRQLALLRDLLQRDGVAIDAASEERLTRAVGKANAFRAVGMANNRNPIAIVVPCHRVIASDGTLCGYGGGLDVKRKLLELEGALSGTLAA